MMLEVTVTFIDHDRRLDVRCPVSLPSRYTAPPRGDMRRLMQRAARDAIESTLGRLYDGGGTWRGVGCAYMTVEVGEGETCT